MCVCVCVCVCVCTYEEGTYCYFDLALWRKSTKEFHVEYDKLEDRPQMPSNLLASSGVTAQHSWLGYMCACITEGSF